MKKRIIEAAKVIQKCNKLVAMNYISSKEALAVYGEFGPEMPLNWGESLPYLVGEERFNEICEINSVEKNSIIEAISLFTEDYCENNKSLLEITLFLEDIAKVIKK